ncbi:hypothetical protein D3C78_1129370 [compost metagenome]
MPAVEPIDEMKVIASDEAIATRVGIFKTTSITGTVINAPAAPTIPDNMPITPASTAASGLLNCSLEKSAVSSPFFGRNIIMAAISARSA